MWKKTMVIGMLCFSTMVLLQTQAMAGLNIGSGGWGWGSYFSTWEIKGGAKPTTLNEYFLVSDAEIIKSSLACVNQGGDKDVRKGNGGITIHQTEDLANGYDGVGDREKGKFHVTTGDLCSKAKVPGPAGASGECEPSVFNDLWGVKNTDCRNANWTPYEYDIQQLFLFGVIENRTTEPFSYSTEKTYYCETNENPRDWGVDGKVEYICVNDGSPIAFNDSYSVRAGRKLTVKPTGVLSNDHDTVDHDQATTPTPTSELTVYQPVDEFGVVVGSVSHGALLLNLNGDGGFTYTPEDGFRGEDSFIYYAQDNNGNKSNEAKVTITVY